VEGRRDAAGNTLLDHASGASSTPGLSSALPKGYGGGSGRTKDAEILADAPEIFHLV
jgi:hypothetical protein